MPELCIEDSCVNPKRRSAAAAARSAEREQRREQADATSSLYCRSA
ncbi:MAG: hypothetical protein ABI627_22025 [Polyangiaceae bacterium]